MIPIELPEETAEDRVPAPESSEPCLAELVTSHEAVQGHVRVVDLAARFRNEPRLEAVGVVDEHGTALGLLDRSKLFLKLSHQYGYALYARAPVTKVLDPSPLVMSARADLSEALGRVLERGESDLYDSIVVTDDDLNFIGLVSVKELILQQTSALSNATVEQRVSDRRTRELERVNELKSRFVAHVTHELRAPVNAIIGMVDLLKHSSREGDVRTMEEMLNLLASSATSLRSLVTNILDLSKLEAGHMDVVAESFDVAAMLRDVAAMTRVLIGPKPVRVEVVAHEGPVELVSDSVKVKQILTNLAGNAAKFTNEGQVRFEIATTTDGVTVTVRDTGIGIPKHKLADVFEAFVQADDVHTRKHEGTGLGLSIASQLLRLIDGRIRVESTPGVGSTFAVDIPQMRK